MNMPVHAPALSATAHAAVVAVQHAPPHGLLGTHALPTPWNELPAPHAVIAANEQAPVAGTQHAPCRHGDGEQVLASPIHAVPQGQPLVPMAGPGVAQTPVERLQQTPKHAVELHTPWTRKRLGLGHAAAMVTVHAPEVSQHDPPQRLLGAHPAPAA